jgi:hypothetical protein
MNSVSTATKSALAEPFAELFEGIGIGNQRMDTHFAGLIAGPLALDKAQSLTRSAAHILFPNLFRRKRSSMHAYRTHNCGAAPRNRRRRDASAVGLGPSQARPWRRAVRRSARPLRPHPDRRPRQQRAASGARASARRIGGDDRRRGRVARARGDQPQSRHRRDRGGRRERHGPVAAEELPLPVAGEADYPEEIRLRYRFLDLRRERLHANIMLRSQVIASIRRRMIEQGFTEFQTPILTASSSPEGARDYLVPSRVHPGKFYALPQAPQMFKQLIMVAGLRPLFPDRALLPRRGRPRRPLARRILPARFRDELRHPGRRVRGDRAGPAPACSRSSPTASR